MSILCGLLTIYLRFRYRALNWVNITVVIYAAFHYYNFTAGERTCQDCNKSKFVLYVYITCSY